jgi:uncharacterized repeat protein (TIGR03803 family)
LLVPAVSLITAGLTTLQAQTFTTLFVFGGGKPQYRQPMGGLIQATDGNLYGTTTSPSSVFRLAPSGAPTTLYGFKGDGIGVPDAYSALGQTTNGNFYGTTVRGGPANVCRGGPCGTIYSITQDGTLRTLHGFSGVDGAFPYAPLIEAGGILYGTTSQGGPNICSGAQTCGTVFKISLAGALTTLHAFSEAGGDYPVAGLAQGTDGNFYGATKYGGTSPGPCADGDGCGTVFKITPSGILTTLYRFSGPDGSRPEELIQATDGNLYGTTQGGGATHNGTVFKITSTSVLTTLYSFSGPDGSFPEELIQATDGNFYGTTINGGSNGCDLSDGCGTIFQLTPSDVGTNRHATSIKAKSRKPELAVISRSQLLSTGSSARCCEDLMSSLTLATCSQHPLPVGTVENRSSPATVRGCVKGLC